MGWYHAKNILDGEIPSARLTDIVEPWFLGDGAEGASGEAFAAFANEHPSVNFHKSLDDMEAATGAKVALISGRTSDNPKLFEAVVAKGCTMVYLEKPGAPTVAELEAMKVLAESKGVKVYMGYNKNVTKVGVGHRDFSKCAEPPWGVVWQSRDPYWVPARGRASQGCPR